MAQQELPLFASSRSPTSAMVSPPFTVAGTLREAAKVSARNGKLTVQVIFLILSPFSLLVLLHYFMSGPLIQKVEDSYEKSITDPKDLRSLVGTELVFLIAFWSVSFLGMMLTIYASSSTCAGKHVAIKDILLWINLGWKKKFVTWLYVTFLTVIYIGLIIVLIKIVNIIGKESSSTYLSSWVVGIFGSLFYLYLAARWVLALVISVVEEDSGNGSMAFGRAQQLIRGRELLGFLLMFVLMVMSMPLYVLFYVTATDDDDELGPITQFVFGSVATVLVCVAKFFSFVVFTVFYYVCRHSNGETLETEIGPGYSPVPQKH